MSDVSLPLNYIADNEHLQSCITSSTLRCLNQAAYRDASNVSIALADLIAPVVEAVRQRKQWLNDFSDDRILVPTDLYEVIRAFQEIQSINPSVEG